MTFDVGPLALEVIATSVDDATGAEEGGAARIELVTELDRGGLTPSLALVDAVLTAVRIPVRVMLRDEEPHEIPDAASRDRLVARARELGGRPVDGLVFGALAAGQVDEPLLAAVAEASGRPLTFHRAFEQARDPVEAIDALRKHRTVDRVLCDGGSGDWTARAARLTAWQRRSGPGLQMLPGGGITDQALEALSAAPAIREVHVGRLVREAGTASGRVSAARVAALVARLSRLRPLQGAPEQ